jgi:hypothetical protein
MPSWGLPVNKRLSGTVNGMSVAPEKRFRWANGRLFLRLKAVKSGRYVFVDWAAVTVVAEDGANGTDLHLHPNHVVRVAESENDVFDLVYRAKLDGFTG